MCWTGMTSREKTPRVAKKDIPVYKMVLGNDNCYHAYYHGFEYKPRQEYQTGIEPIMPLEGISGIVNINSGFHSYDVKDTMVTTKRILYGPLYYNVENTISGHVLEIYHIKTHKLNCVIPAGATYYKNNNGEYVSDRIRVVSGEPLKES